jgi:hypothetical protein
MEGNHHLQATGSNLKEIEPFDGGAGRPAADLFDDADPMVRVNDLVADVENVVVIHGGPSPGT